METGTMRTATEMTSSQESSLPYQYVIFRYTGVDQRRRQRRRRFSPLASLLDGVDLGEDLVGADFLGVGLHHGVGQLLHLRAVGERHALELAGLLERDQL